MQLLKSNALLCEAVLWGFLLCAHTNAQALDEHLQPYHQADGGTDASDIPLTIPLSNATVSVKVFNGFDALVHSSALVRPAPGSLSNESADVLIPGFSFLIEHASTDSKVMFDLGWGQNESYAVEHGASAIGVEILDIHNIPDQLTRNSVPLVDIDAVIWRCSILDTLKRLRELDRLPHWTRLFVGPGTVSHILALNSSDPVQAPVLELRGHRVKEIPFQRQDLKIGGFDAYDFFGDGSFYLLNTPGHSIGHMSGLARVTPGPNSTFIMLAGDVAHHPALIRPSPLVPLLDELKESLPVALRNVGVPAYNQPFLVLPTGNGSGYADPALAQKTLEALTAFDARPDVLLFITHDSSIGSIIGEPPAQLDDWYAKDLKEKAAWAYLEEGNLAFRWPAPVA